jgi:cytochrome bd-type quinol oxidase subunit 2
MIWRGRERLTLKFVATKLTALLSSSIAFSILFPKFYREYGLSSVYASCMSFANQVGLLKVFIVNIIFLSLVYWYVAFSPWQPL